MTDVRALLAAERQSRRITHPHLSYTKSGVLMCNICTLNVKSEALWEGHLKSANHRKNIAAQASRQASLDANTGKGVKRKIEDVDEVQEERDETDTADARKKPKSRPESTIAEAANDVQAGPVLPEETAGAEAKQPPASIAIGDNVATTNGVTPSPPDETVDEDEWAAFEREVARLAKDKRDYSSATITAAPVTADQLKAQDDEDKRRKLETEAEDEREDEAVRLAEEFDIMEEMEERVRRLREKRDALRNAAKTGDDAGQTLPEASIDILERSTAPTKADGLQEDDNEDEDEDDWYS